MRAGNRRGRVASVIGIDHDYHGFANSLPDRPAKPKVLVEAEAELCLIALKLAPALCFFKEALVSR
jgi:hypothetical protein